MSAPAVPDLSAGMVNSPLPSTPAGNGAPAPGPAPSTAAISGEPDLSGGMVAGPDPTDPSVTGEMMHPAGYKIIVPKDGEEFGDTVKRAIAYQRSLTPEQQQDAMSKELGSTPGGAAKKVGGTLAAAGAIGFLGPALMAAPGELAIEGHALLAAGIRTLVPALTAGTAAVGEWAEAHPVAAKAIVETLKLATAGSIVAKVSGAGKKVINSAPNE